MSGGGHPPPFLPPHEEDGAMTAVIALPGNTASTFLTHFSGGGLSDDTYVVERFKTMVDGDIRRCVDELPAAKNGRRKTKYATASLKAVRRCGRSATK